MNNKLKPCPFCGNKKFEITPKLHFYELQGIYGDAAIEVRCWNCSTEMWEHSRTEKNYDKRVAMLAEKWNRRATDND
jgi:hypothetical protein